MTAKIDPISGLSYGWSLGEDNWNTGMDSNLVKLGATVNISVLDFVTTPSVTTNGTRYIVTATASGAFVGQEGKLAARVEGAWVFYTLPEGCIVYRVSNTSHYKYESSSYNLLVNLSSYLTSATAASTYATIAQAKTEYITLAVSDESTALTTGTAKLTFRMPYAMTLTGVRSNINTVSSSGIVTVDINESGSTILSTKLTIDGGEKTSTTAATAAVISDSGLADDAEITIDIDVAGTGAKGLKVTLIGTRG